MQHLMVRLYSNPGDCSDTFVALVQFQPLYYTIGLHVEVGVECDIPLLFFTLHIRIHLGAWLNIQGPDFGGTA
jgi:hypothetical protein